MNGPLRIQILLDGKPGHQNQSLGLADAIGRLVPASTDLVPLSGCRTAPGRIARALKISASLPPPDVLAGAGHAVHLPLLALAWRWSVPSVVLMKPSLPLPLFGLCLVPEHDLQNARPAENVVVTRGALNRILPPQPGEKNGRLLLIGGPSSSHGWDGKRMVEMVSRIVDGPGWEVTDSRRTPPGTLERLAAACPELEIWPHADTGPGWLPDRLASAGQVWVTEDSVSMIYEALSSGARVGLLPVPVLKKNSRVVRGVARLVEENYVTPHDHWTPGQLLASPPDTLREADRCARLVIRQFFPRLLTL